MNADPGASFAAVADLGPGLVPGVQVIQQGVAVIARTTVGIVEAPAGIYTVTLTAPAQGKYTLVWDTGTVVAGSMAIEDLLVGDTSVGAGDSYETVADLLQTGLVGTAGVEVIDGSDSSVAVAHTTAGIAEFPAASGIYWKLLTAPASGEYTVVWDNGAGEEATEPLVVAGVSAVAMGPCSAWTTVEQVAECCNSDVGSAIDLYESAILEASEFLYALSGRRFAGSCERTVRPCGSGHECGVQTLPWGRRIGWGAGRWEGSYSCGCSPLSTVWLAGYPITSILEVTIDGDVVDPATYQLQRHRELVRMNDPATGAALYWPACQNLARPSTADGTFSISYTHGVDPPLTGKRAAADLACQLYRACTSSAAEGSTDCALPSGVTRVTRNGVVIERQAFGAWAYHPSLRVWRTGIPSLDGFLSAFNPGGLKRRPAFASPDGPRYARTG